MYMYNVLIPLHMYMYSVHLNISNCICKFTDTCMATSPHTCTYIDACPHRSCTCYIFIIVYADVLVHIHVWSLVIILYMYMYIDYCIQYVHIYINYMYLYICFKLHIYVQCCLCALSFHIRGSLVTVCIAA